MLKEKRDVCFELLRIIATLMVVIQHLLGHGGVLDSYNFICSGYVVFWHLDSLCYIAVNIFVLISGYFLIECKFKPSKIVKLFIQVESYSVLILCISMLAFKHKPTINDLIWSIFPITGKAYWFCSVYMLLIFASPLLNILIRTYTKRQLIIIDCFMLVIFSVIPTFMPWSRDILTHGRDIIWFMTLYQVAAYIRIYVVTDDVHIKKKSIYYFFIYYVLASGGGVDPDCFAYNRKCLFT